MASFPIPDPGGDPTLAAYLFEADLVISIIPPSSFTAIPTTDLSASLRWLKNDMTSDEGNLYSEVYRSTDLVTWTLLETLANPVTVYTDTGLSERNVYYYRIRFVRKDADGVVLNISSYTIPIGVRATASLSFEPRDTYSNKFLKFLIGGLPGTRIYDHTEAAHFSADNNLWQTTSLITDSFDVKANGAVVDSRPTDASALYAKRPVSFILTNRYTNLVGEDSTGEGELIRVHTYLIHTFLMGYAIQFLTLYEKYQQILADKHIGYSPIYTKGFKPVVADQKSTTIADLYLTFGKMLKIKPLKAVTNAQGIDRYRSALLANFSNVADLGKYKAILGACSGTLGITTETLFEYYKYHWFKSDREMKLYTLGSGEGTYYLSAGIAGLNNDLVFTMASGYEQFATFVEYFAERVHPSGDGWLEVTGSSCENPYQYILKCHISEGVTTAAHISGLLSTHYPSNNLLTTINSGADTGAGVILAQHVLDSGALPSGVTGLTYYGPLPLARHTPWVAWEDAALKLYNKSFNLEDTHDLVPGIDSCVVSRIISETDSTTVFKPESPAAGTEDIFGVIGNDRLIAMRDDDSEGADYGSGTLVGDKRILFKMALTTTKMTWLKKAYLKITVERNTHAGYLRLYRIRKKYDNDHVCWQHRDEETVSGYNWSGAAYVGSTKTWVTGYWDTNGAAGSDDSLFLKEFAIDEISAQTTIYLDVTDVLQDLYKYENSELNLAQVKDPENILETGFMLTADGLPNRSMFVCAAHTVGDQPKIEWERLSRGYYACDTPTQATYFYADGTTRYGHLLVRQSDREPISYVKTVHERLRNNEVMHTANVKITFTGAVPATFVVDARIYGTTSGAVGKIASVGDTSVFIEDEMGKKFSVGETVRLLSSPTSATAVISAISYTGDMYVDLSRVPVGASLLRAFYTGVATTDAATPTTYPDYETWTEEGDGVRPLFLTNVPAGALEIPMAEFDPEHPDRVNLKTSLTLAQLGDIIVTYQYEYDFIPLGRTVSDDGGVKRIEGCSRTDSHLYSMSANDAQYQNELMMPMPSSAEHLPDISGSDPSDSEYSDYNIGVLCDAIANIRRYNGKIDAFKYYPQEKTYRFNQMYHTFLRRIS